MTYLIKMLTRFLENLYSTSYLNCISRKLNLKNPILLSKTTMAKQHLKDTF